ncbi:MAG: hypothetical protein R6V58_06725 [Planctomycetota bacterium]
MNSKRRRGWLIACAVLLIGGLVIFLAVQQWFADNPRKGTSRSVTLGHVLRGRPAPAGPSHEFNWMTLVVLLMALVGLGAVIAVMAIALVRLLPQALNAPETPPARPPERPLPDE